MVKGQCCRSRMGSRKDKIMDTVDKIDKPDYYNMSKPKVDKELRLRKCFRCGKEKKMGKFERYCSIACRNYATKHDTSAYKISW